MPKAPHFLLEDVFPDGGYSALVKHYGLEFAVHYVSGEVRVRGCAIPSASLSKWKINASAKAVKAVCEARIASLGPEHAAAHKALYGLA